MMRVPWAGTWTDSCSSVPEIRREPDHALAAGRDQALDREHHERQRQQQNSSMS